MELPARPHFATVLATCCLLTACASSSTTAAVTPTPAATLKPTAVGQGQCQAANLGDGSTYAQIAIANTTCTTVVLVAAQARTARGGAYKIDGFSCLAIKEGSGSPWSSAWGATYYAYSCVNGTQQLAFNWGTDYTYAKLA